MKLFIVVDAQNDFVNGKFGSKENEIIAKDIALFLEKEKEKAVANGETAVAFFTQDFHTEENYSKYKESNIYPIHCVPDTKGFEICDALKPYAKVCIRKDSFCSIELLNAITELDSENLEICLMGFCFDICVLSNTIMLRSMIPDVKISVAANLCGSYDKSLVEPIEKILKNQAIDVIYPI